MPDLSGLATLAMIGLGAVVALAFALPVAGLYGLAWLLEPRAGEVAWQISFWLSIAWGIAAAAFFGTAFFGRR